MRGTFTAVEEKEKSFLIPLVTHFFAPFVHCTLFSPYGSFVPFICILVFAQRALRVFFPYFYFYSTFVCTLRCILFLPYGRFVTFVAHYFRPTGVSHPSSHNIFALRCTLLCALRAPRGLRCRLFWALRVLRCTLFAPIVTRYCGLFASKSFEKRLHGKYQWWQAMIDANPCIKTMGPCDSY